ncbi:MAG: hypothetical protein HZB14_02410 [Actinobacteria bacterium]|nr:hypothetical protein [Actinomycetota bacterium]
MPFHSQSLTSKRHTAIALGFGVCLAILSILYLTAGSARAATATGANTGGAEFAPTPATTPGLRATIAEDGRTAIAPVDAPLEVQKAIWAANEITHKPYIYGGGHKSFKSRGYDCSGTISYALHGGDLLDAPLNSSGFMTWGVRGKGNWITVYTNPGHAYTIIAGLRLDTSGKGEKGPRWRSESRSARGFRARHPEGL